MNDDEELAQYLVKIDELIKQIHNIRDEIKFNLKKLAKLQDYKVYIIPSIYNEVKFNDYIIAKNKEDALNIGISYSAYDEIVDVCGDGDIQEDEIEELNFND